MHHKFCKIGLTLESFDFYLLLIDLHVYLKFLQWNLIEMDLWRERKHDYQKSSDRSIQRDIFQAIRSYRGSSRSGCWAPKYGRIHGSS